MTSDLSIVQGGNDPPLLTTTLGELADKNERVYGNKIWGANPLNNNSQAGKGQGRPSDEQIREWVREKLARHKAPQYVFWLGHQDGPGRGRQEMPKTGSGKVMKHVLRRWAEDWVEERGREQLGSGKAKL